MGPHRAAPKGRIRPWVRRIRREQRGCDDLRVLPPDRHVHTEWSWDAPGGSMERTCARAVAIGLPAIAFTEHADYTTWTIFDTGPEADDDLTALATPEGQVTPPALDADGYLDCVQRCRDRFPG